jgi:diguanylate cyclase (GGDEF)-like protein
MSVMAWPSFRVTEASTRTWGSPLRRTKARKPSFEGLRTLYHELLDQRGIDELLAHVADAVADLIPYTSVLIAEADVAHGSITPVLARGDWSAETMRLRPKLGEGLLGWVIQNGVPLLTNDASRDPRAGHVAGTPYAAPEAIMSLPLCVRGTTIGALSLYREGAGASFSEDELELACWFADAVTLALSHAKTRAQLEALAHTDDLTGCLNRRGLCLGFDRALESAVAAQEKVALLIVDLDDFKVVNDTYGHAIGDLLLQHAVNALRAYAPPSGSVGRLGGDEFALVFTVIDEPELQRASKAAAAAIARVSFLTDVGEVSATASVGAACSEPNDADFAELLRRADSTMYDAKAVLVRDGGRRRYRAAAVAPHLAAVPPLQEERFAI